MSVEETADDVHVCLGYVAGAHGVRGVLRVKLFNMDTTLRKGVRVVLRLPDGSKSEEVEIEGLSPKPGTQLVRVTLAGVRSRESAEALRGREVWIERAKLPEAPPDEYYLHDVIGYAVVRGEEMLGEVTGVTSNGVQDLFIVGRDREEWLLPAIPHFILDLNTDQRRIVVDVHDDMLPERRP